jgi:hypothetical protein
LDNSTVFLLAVVALLALMFVFLFATARRRDAQRADAAPSIEERAEAATASLPVPVGHASPSGRELERTVALERRSSQAVSPDAPPPALPAPIDEEALGVTRRQVLNRGIVTTFTLAISGFGAACVAMLWPSLSGGFGSKIRVGSFDDVMEEIADKREPFYVGAGRTYINPWSTASSRGSWRSTRSAPTWDAGCHGARRRSGSSAPATGRSTTGSARRRVVPPPGAWTTSWRQLRTASSSSTPRR